MHHIFVDNVTGRAENSVRVWGSPESKAHDITLDRVDVTFDRWTKYKGEVYDNRPTTAVAALPAHAAVGFSIQDADNVTLRNCGLHWGPNWPAATCTTVQQERVTGLKVEGFQGDPSRGGCTNEGHG
jgi:hypothetical protein